MGHATRGGTLKPVESSRSVVPFDRGNVRFRPTIGPHAIEGGGERDPRERATLRTFVVPQPKHKLLQRVEHLGRLALFRHDAHVVAPTRRPVVSATKKKSDESPDRAARCEMRALTVSGARRTDTFRRRARGRHCLSRRGGVRPRRAVRRPPPPWPPCSSASARTWSPAWTPSYAGASP